MTEPENKLPEGDRATLLPAHAQRAKAGVAGVPASAHPHRSMGPAVQEPSRSPHSLTGKGRASGRLLRAEAGGFPPGRWAAGPSRGDMSAMTKVPGGQAVCFVSHTGEVFPCGYLPVSLGNKDTPLPIIQRESRVFADIRDDSKLEGKCGICEYKKVCMGCLAYAATGITSRGPNCGYTPVRMTMRNQAALFGNLAVDFVPVCRHRPRR